MVTQITPSPWRAYLALGIAALTLGFSAIFVRWANAPGVVAAFYRMSIASIVLVLPFLRGYKRLQARGNFSWSAAMLAVWAGVFFAADLASWMTGVVLSGATIPTLLANTAPLWVGFGAMIFFKEKLNRSFWLGLLLALLGAVVILGLDFSLSSDFGIGALYGLLSGFFYGGYFLFVQKARLHLNSISIAWVSGATSALLLLLAALAFGAPLTGYPTTTYAIFLAMGLVTQVTGYLAITYALGHLPASLVSPTLLAQPVITAFLAGPLLGERISTSHVLGGAIVIVGVLFVHRSRSKDNSSPLPKTGHLNN